MGRDAHTPSRERARARRGVAGRSFVRGSMIGIARASAWTTEARGRARARSADGRLRADVNDRARAARARTGGVPGSERGRMVPARGFLGDWLSKNDERGKEKNGRGKKRREPARRRRPPPVNKVESPFEEFTNEELRPDFGFRRDLHELYDVPSLDEEPLGAGSYGIVRKATSKKTGETFALKTLKKAPWKTAPQSIAAVKYYHGKLKNEVEVMKTIGASLSVVYLYDSFEDDESVHLLMELCSGGRTAR